MNTRITLEAKKNPILSYTPVSSWGVFIFVMSLLPSSNLPDQLIAMEDFLIHGTIYVVLSILFLWGRRRHAGRLHLIDYVVIPAIGFAFGLLVELAQTTLTDYRHFELSDILANGIGAVVGSFVSRLLFHSKS